VEVVRGPLPRNPLGKVLRRVLRDQHLDGELPAGNGEPEGNGKPDAA
jgi:hypothetical protein